MAIRNMTAERLSVRWLIGIQRVLLSSQVVDKAYFQRVGWTADRNLGDIRV